MGGNVFINTTRIDKIQLSKIVKQFMELFQLFNLQVKQPPEIEDKESFGDVDLVVIIEKDLRQNLDELIEKIEIGIESPENCIRNNQYLHFLTKDRCQVDVLMCTSETFEMIFAYYSHGDFSHILGRILIKWNLKYTCSGLKYRYVNPFTTLPHYFFLSNKPSKVAEFLALPLDFFNGNKGYTYDQIFNILVNCHFFNYKLNYEVNSKTKERPTFKKFEEYLISNNIPLESITWNIDLSDKILKEAIEFFHKHNEFELFIKELDALQWKHISKEKFNGLFVMDLLQIQGKFVGKIIHELRERFGAERFIAWVCISDSYEKKIKVMKVFVDLLNYGEFGEFFNE